MIAKWRKIHIKFILSFLMTNEKLSRDTATSVCRREGGYLAVLNSIQEENVITQYLLICEAYIQGSLNQSKINVLNQNQVPKGSPKRGLLTTPHGFSVRQSLIPRASLGVWSDIPVPKHTILGEYEGDLVDYTTDFTYTWQVGSGHRTLYIDGKNESISNWLRYINCARNTFEENIDTFNCDSKKFYFTTKELKTNSELLVWYGTAYGEWLGIKRNNPEKDFPIGSWNIRVGSIYYLHNKWWNSDNSDITYTNWARETVTKVRERTVHIVLTNRNGKWQWVPERDYSYYVKDNSLKLSFLCEIPLLSNSS
ncbi:histone-lysine N-methyltransferase PRDM7-like [Saccostrea echinata]|uniref:histone-lysine N-methyltransferase PRDM7-like n=1 Tax=Saccostrea echinata TaxID=191078 RepID=UPI002A81F396|nr:histone-lysine N-methyltransferase PRDM7-like [Saccostrea echinata]